MMVVAAALGICAAAAWMAAFYASIRLLGMLSGRKSVLGMLVSGFAWFDARNFAPEAAPMRRVLGYGFVVFFVCVITGIVVSIIASAPR